MKNAGKKDIRAFAGTVKFLDLFGDTVMSVRLKYTDGIEAGATVKWNGGIDYNQFLDRHRKLRAAKVQDLSVALALTQVIYTDGTVEKLSGG